MLTDSELTLALAADLNQADARDKAALFSLLGKLVKELGVGSDHDEDTDAKEMANRSEGREFQLVIMRLLSVLDNTNSDMKQESRPMSNCLKIHATVKMFSCDPCGARSNEERKLEDHFQVWYCINCNLKFESKDEFSITIIWRMMKGDRNKLGLSWAKLSHSWGLKL